MEAAMPADLAPSPQPADPAGDAVDARDRGWLDAFRRERDREAMGHLLRAHADAAFRVARRLVRNAADAEDAVQEAFVRCTVHAATFRGRGTVRGWILAITANVARNRLVEEERRRRRERRVADAQPPTPPSDPDARDDVLRALEALPPRYRTPIAMRYLDALAFADIAVALGLREKSVRTRVGRGLGRLRRALSGRRGEVAAGAVVAALTNAAPAPAPASLATVADAAVAKGVAIGVAGTAIVTLKAVALAALAVGALATAGAAWLARPPRFVVEHSAPAPAGDAADAALACPVSIDAAGTIDDVLAALRDALPRDRRIEFAPVDIPELRTGLAWAAHRSAAIVELRVVDHPLREALDALCAGRGWRWHAAADAIVVDRPLADDARRPLTDAFAAARGERELAAAAEGLVAAGDVDLLRPLLVALGDGGWRGDVLARRLPPGVWSLGDGVGQQRDRPSPVVAFVHDAEVIAAVERAVSSGREPRATLLRLGGELRLRSLVPGCIGLAGLRNRRAGNFAEELDRWLGRSSTQDLALAATQALGRIGDARAVQPLLDLLAAVPKPHQPDGILLDALGRLRDRRAVAPLLVIAVDRRGWAPTRGDAIAALGRIGDDSVVEPLGAVLLDAGDDLSFTRDRIPQALVDIGGDRAVELLCAAATQDVTGASVGARSMHSAITALGEVGGARAEEALIAILPRHSEGETASAALARIHDAALVPRLAAMLRTMQDDDSYRHVAAALAGMRTADSERILVESIPTADDPRLWSHVCALGATRTTVDALLRLVADDAPPTARLIAARRLAPCGDDATRRALELVARDPDHEVRLAALEGFRVLLDRDDLLPRAQVEAWLAEPDDALRARAFEMIVDGAFADADTRRAIRLRALDDPSPVVRRAVVGAYLSGEPAAGLEAIVHRYAVALRADADAEVRRMIAQRLFVWPLPQAPLATYVALGDALLATATSDADARTRALAGSTLARLSYALDACAYRPARLDAQREALARAAPGDADARVRDAIARALGRSNDYLDGKMPWSDDPPAALEKSDF